MDDYITTDTGTGIYGYLNLETNEIDYVGQTSTSFRQRDQNHRRKEQNRSPPFDYKLQAHPDKYIMIPLAYCNDVDSLDLLETFYIYYFNTIDKDNYNWGGDTIRGKWHPSFRGDLDDEEIKKLYIEEELSTYQIGEKFGVYHSTINKRLKKQGIKVQDKRIRNDLDDEEIKKLYIEEGLSTYQIGEKFGVSDSTIGRRLKKQGVKVQDKNIRNDLDDEEIKNLYIKDGLSTYQIGEKFGVSDVTISNRLKKQEIKLRGRSKNTSNYYRVSKTKTKKTKQGFTWVYAYSENNKRKRISSVSLETLKKKVQAKGLPWYKINDR
ncbi:MAG: hypothetical protein II670_14630 [Alphaproteobacteria bacterium]|nr:hypothetical protein [Alphaproteobacteria bacterium]